MLFESRGFLLDHLLSHGRFLPAARVLGGPRRMARRPVRTARQILRALTPALVAAHMSRHPPQLRGLPSWVDAGKLTASRANAPRASMSPGRRWSVIQTAPFTGQGVAFEADEICAAVCGVDSRRPFADVDLWEFVLSLPAEVKFPTRRTKPLLREAMRGLMPDALIDRRDKTFFDEFHLAKADYPTLERLLIASRHRIDGIDYGLLRERLEHRDMRIYELQWARNVARVHAFLGQW
jgi:asparagine synthase (glutamine-hydrolysing)